MSANAVVAALVASLVVVGAVQAQTIHEHHAEPSSAPLAKTPATGPDSERVQKLIVDITNQFRAEHGRGRLRVNEQLGKSAHGFAAYLARTDKFSHTADGKQPWDRTAAAGYPNCIVAENIAWELNTAGFTTRNLATALMQGWEKSPEHRKNLLDPDLDEIGVAVAHSAKTDRYYAVQDFGRPKSEAIAFTIANHAETPVSYTVDGKKQTVKPHYLVTQESCRPPQLAFQLPGAAKAETFQPRSGSHYVITGDSEHLKVSEE